MSAGPAEGTAEGTAPRTTEVARGAGAQRFRYRASSPAGRVSEGTLDAASRELALAELRRRELFVMRLEPEGVPVPGASPARAGSARLSRGDGGTALPLWTRTLATLLAGGARLDDALAFVSERAGATRLGVAAEQVGVAVRGGSTLAGAMRAHPRVFSPLYVAMVAAGEEGGALPLVLDRLAAHLEERAEQWSELRAALVYPLLLAVGSAAGVLVLLLFVLPRFAAMLADVGGALPLSTRLLLGMGHFFGTTWWLWVALAAALVVGARHAATDPRLRRRLDALRLGWPFVGALEQAWVTTQLTRTLAILLPSGVPVLGALRIARAGIANAALQEQAMQAERAVADGAPLSGALADLLPTLATRLLAVGEESGRLPEVCARVADSYDREVRRTMRALIGVLEPSLVLFFAAVVGFVALAMLQAIYSVNAHAF